jgi:hypothetical protein
MVATAFKVNDPPAFSNWLKEFFLTDRGMAIELQTDGEAHHFQASIGNVTRWATWKCIENRQYEEAREDFQRGMAGYLEKGSSFVVVWHDITGNIVPLITIEAAN